ncbi:MAG TPA: SAM-dependent methyltransferase [Rhodocyclaceae bacterium]|nr:SAM-dependent methyltransferase [Rhodocyclaceae bacterium]
MPDYQVKIETVPIPGGADFIIRSLLNREQFCDPLGEAENLGISSASWPLFGLIWPSARILAAAMQVFEFDGRKILEIGCGVALASMVAHRRHADVTASDCHPLTEEFLLENLSLNQLPPLEYQTGNWAADNPGLGKFDLIIGSDILYERDQPELLSNFIDRHSNTRVEIIIVDPDRGNRSSFNRNMARLGYSFSETRADCIQASGEAYKGRILNYRRGMNEQKA